MKIINKESIYDRWDNDGIIIYKKLNKIEDRRNKIIKIQDILNDKS